MIENEELKSFYSLKFLPKASSFVLLKVKASYSTILVNPNSNHYQPTFPEELSRKETNLSVSSNLICRVLLSSIKCVSVQNVRKQGFVQCRSQKIVI